MNIRTKRATLLISSLGGGGAEGVCVSIANGLAKQGWLVDLVVLNLDSAVYLERVISEVNLVNLHANKARHAFFPLLKYLTKVRPERVAVFNYELAVLLVLMRNLSTYDFKIIARNINTFSHARKLAKGFWRKGIVRVLIDKLYCRVDHVVNQCKAMEKDLLEVFPTLEGKTSVIYNPVNKIIEDAAQKIDFNKVKKENYLLCVGRLEPQKGFHHAIQAFARLANGHPELRLKIIGEGSLGKDLKTLALSLEVAHKVDFEGFQKDMIPYYLKARATLLTSLYEGFPNVLIESIHLGTPVVAYDCPSGPQEIIKAGQNGYLVSYLDVDAFSNGIEMVISSGFSGMEVAETSVGNTTSDVISSWIEVIM